MTLQQKKEEARKGVRHYLALRPGIAQSVETITRGVKRELNLTEEQVFDALNHLVGRLHVKAEPDGDGATLHYQITADGELYDERN